MYSVQRLSLPWKALSNASVLNLKGMCCMKQSDHYACRSFLEKPSFN